MRLREPAGSRFPIGFPTAAFDKHVFSERGESAVSTRPLPAR